VKAQGSGTSSPGSPVAGEAHVGPKKKNPISEPKVVCYIRYYKKAIPPFGKYFIHNVSRPWGKGTSVQKSINEHGKMIKDP
jgi:hypothetical protein